MNNWNHFAIKPRNAINVLDHQLKGLAWLTKKQPTNYEIYYRWENLTRHYIGKIFGFKSETYKVFLKMNSLLGFSFRAKRIRIKRFLANQNEKKAHLKVLIDYVTAI